MSLDTNPLFDMGFEAPNVQNWNNLIEYIKGQCGVIGEFELSDESIVDQLQKHVCPVYSNYDGKREYCQLMPENVLSTAPVTKYRIPVNGIVSIRNIYTNQLNYLGSDMDESLRGYNGTSIEDNLIARNWQDAKKYLLPVESWSFLAPNILQIIEISNFNTHQIKPMLELNTTHMSPDTIQPTMYENFRDMCTGYIQVVVGTMRTKVDGVNGVNGTVQTNGEELKQAGKQTLQEVKQLLITTPPDDYLHLF